MHIATCICIFALIGLLFFIRKVVVEILYDIYYVPKHINVRELKIFFAFSFQINMKYLYVLSFLLALVAVNGETYSTENDDFDIDSAVADLDSLKGLVACLLDTGNCNEVIADFKSKYILPSNKV